jgi:hypothetical protein
MISHVRVFITIRPFFISWFTGPPTLKFPDDGWPSSDDESSDVDNVHNVKKPDFNLLRPRIAHEPGRESEGASMQIRLEYIFCQFFP